MCSTLGIVNENGRPFSASGIIKGIRLMNERCNGLGGGFAAYGLYPEYKDYYALHILVKDLAQKDQVAEMLEEHVNIYKDEEIATRNPRHLTGLHPMALLRRCA